MNKFIQHIPNCVDVDHRLEFEFETLAVLAQKLGRSPKSLVYDEPHVLWVSDNENEWRVLGKISEPVEGLDVWKGPVYIVTEIKTIRGYGNPDYDPQFIGAKFKVRSEDIKIYSSFRGEMIGELKNGKYFIGRLS